MTWRFKKLRDAGLEKSAVAGSHAAFTASDGASARLSLNAALQV
jgi:hypothetical protein